MKTKTRKKVLPRNQTIPGRRTARTGSGRPSRPGRASAPIAETAKTLAYSARKNRAKRMPLYSVWKPAASSDSASIRSNGVRLRLGDARDEEHDEGDEAPRREDEPPVGYRRAASASPAPRRSRRATSSRPASPAPAPPARPGSRSSQAAPPSASRPAARTCCSSAQPAITTPMTGRLPIESRNSTPTLRSAGTTPGDQRDHRPGHQRRRPAPRSARAPR